MILIALGGNRPYEAGTPADTLVKALRVLPERGDITVVARSGLWASPAWPDPSDPPYANAAARLETRLPPEALMTRLLETERRFGRDRENAERWAARTLDLDLIDYRGRILQTDHLTLPHPRAHERAFVLAPVLDIAPLWTHPVHGSGRELFAGLHAGAKDGLTRLRSRLSQTHKAP